MQWKIIYFIGDLMKFFKCLGIIAIMIFSFYYINEVSLFGIRHNNLYQEIEKKSGSHKVSMVNAEIMGDAIIPGLSGLEVDIKKSYNNMQSKNQYQESLLIYQMIMPDISINNNKDKIIIKGNYLKNETSFIINNKDVSSYFESREIEADVLTHYNDLSTNSKLEMINYDYDNYRRLENVLEKRNKKNNLCFVYPNFKELCLLNKKTLISYTYELTRVNIHDLIPKVKAGNIYYIGPNAELEDVILLLKEIDYKGIKIVYLSKLIEEQRD
jgi:hypothetical protein